MEEKYTFNGEAIDPSNLCHTATLEFAKPNCSITFHRQSDDSFSMGPKIGTLDFNGPALVFEGDAEESAKVFIDWIAQAFAVRLKEEYQRGYEDCLTNEAKK